MERSSSRNGVLYLNLKRLNVKHLGKKGSELGKNVGIIFLGGDMPTSKI